MSSLVCTGTGERRKKSREGSRRKAGGERESGIGDQREGGEGQDGGDRKTGGAGKEDGKQERGKLARLKEDRIGEVKKRKKAV